LALGSDGKLNLQTSVDVSCFAAVLSGEFFRKSDSAPTASGEAPAAAPADALPAAEPPNDKWKALKLEGVWKFASAKKPPGEKLYDSEKACKLRFALKPAQDGALQGTLTLLGDDANCEGWAQYQNRSYETMGHPFVVRDFAGNEAIFHIDFTPKKDAPSWVKKGIKRATVQIAADSKMLTVKYQLVGKSLFGETTFERVE
jgi:hypothetical protein